MGFRLFILILVSVALSSIAQVILKSGMGSATSQIDFAVDGQILVGIKVLTNPIVIAGLLLYGLGAVLWLTVLARLDVSQAYPFVGLGFIFTMMLGYLVLGEHVGFQRVVGTMLIAAGVVLVARS